MERDRAIDMPETEMDAEKQNEEERDETLFELLICIDKLKIVLNELLINVRVYL